MTTQQPPTSQRPPWTQLSRRGVLRIGVGGTAAAIAYHASALDLLAQEQQGYAVFNVTDGRTIEAIVERIWPESDTPGAVEIGVPRYIDNALIGAYQHKQLDYHKGLRNLDAAARRMHGTVFAALEPDQQTALLESMENDELDEFDEGEGSEFFSTIHQHTMEGLFADPIYGGNKDMAAWRAVGYPGPFYAISEQSQQSFEPLDLPMQSITDL
ncbi:MULTISPECIES: gluconate 2-dehydrogenase subunit 3 family protein [unclassified Roseitalea]|uniref:gluconate 2-dehydrogenase subunit 3 family protein n=1 Tax=unclassified Roseitalea TaxID=2639107 RepID=UPI00273EF2D1|nr:MULTISPECIES: gluconate 2-dehydrogenase subunit 3 family protein [unclassified Roseitalea]